MASNALEAPLDEEPKIPDADIIAIIADISRKLETINLMLRYFGWTEPEKHLEAAIQALSKLADSSKQR